MPYKSQEKRKEQNKKWRLKNKEKVSEYKKKEYLKNKENYSLRNSVFRKQCISFYSKDKNECECCKENIFQFLSIDHINNNGKEDRKIRGFGNMFYKSLVKSNFPEGYQVLCHNCNLSKGFYGICPHKRVGNGE